MEPVCGPSRPFDAGCAPAHQLDGDPAGPACRCRGRYRRRCAAWGFRPRRRGCSCAAVLPRRRNAGGARRSAGSPPSSPAAAGSGCRRSLRVSEHLGDGDGTDLPADIAAGPSSGVPVVISPGGGTRPEGRQPRGAPRRVHFGFSRRSARDERRLRVPRRGERCSSRQGVRSPFRGLKPAALDIPEHSREHEAPAMQDSDPGTTLAPPRPRVGSASRPRRPRPWSPSAGGGAAPARLRRRRPGCSPSSAPPAWACPGWRRRPAWRPARPATTGATATSCCSTWWTTTPRPAAGGVHGVRRDRGRGRGGAAGGDRADLAGLRGDASRRAPLPAVLRATCWRRNGGTRCASARRSPWKR